MADVWKLPQGSDVKPFMDEIQKTKNILMENRCNRDTLEELRVNSHEEHETSGWRTFRSETRLALAALVLHICLNRSISPI